MRAKNSQAIYYAVCDSPHSLSSAIYFLPWGSASHFSPFFNAPPPLSHRLARCWLNSCLQPWRRNITENCFIMLKLVNKERAEDQFKSQGTPGEGLHISPPRIKSIAARPHRWSHSLMRDISVQFFFNSRSAPHHSLLLDISLFFLLWIHLHQHGFSIHF